TNATIGTLTTQAYTATGVYSDNSAVNLTTQPQTTWASSDPAVATLIGTTATGLSAGTTTISATFNGVTGTAQLHVTGATLTSIDVTPATPTAQVGFNVPFRAIGHVNDNTTLDLTADVLWGSTVDTVASVSNASGSEGLASGLSVGTSNITASIAGTTGQTTLTVSNSPLTMIEVSPATASIALGTTQSFGAIARFMDGTSLDVTAQVSWSSSLLSVATVSNATGTKGRATSVSAGGPVTITASFNGASGNAQLTVTPATLNSIAITPPMGTVTVGSTVGFTANGTYSDGSTQDITALVTWTSMDTNVATIDNAAGMNGIATGVAPGDTTIEAAVGTTTTTATLHVDP
ncbi:MAG: Ig-like domain-containing protein, partial [Polyangiaceae bacterium]